MKWLKDAIGWVGDTIVEPIGNALGFESTGQAERSASIQRNFEANQAELARQFTSAEAVKAREHQLSMSNTAVSRRMADLEKAGLNPILAVQQGVGAPASSSPMAAAAPSAKGSKADVDVGRVRSFIQAVAAVGSAAMFNRRSGYR